VTVTLGSNNRHKGAGF